jgi:quinol monooxygenase YgiN
MFSVIVVFDIHRGKMDQFMPLMLENAATSLDRETGCHQFDVSTDPSRPEEVLLYEIYSDAAAFDAHLQSEHYKRFNADSSALIATKHVRTYRNVQQ